MDTDINRDYRTVLVLLLKVDPAEVGNIHYLGKPSAFVNYTFAYGKMIQDAFTHGAYLMWINIFIIPKVVFVLRQCIYMVFHGHIGMADYLLQPIDYLLQIASFLLLCLIEYHSNLLLKDENRVTNGAQNYCNWVG